jgi:hypothetical protein
VHRHVYVNDWGLDNAFAAPSAVTLCLAVAGFLISGGYASAEAQPRKNFFSVIR